MGQDHDRDPEKVDLEKEISNSLQMLKMEVGRTELDFDEFEKLLGEIPNATSGNPQSEEAATKSVSLNGGLAPIHVNSYKGPLTEKLQSNGSPDERKLLINKTQGSPIKRVQSEEANLVDDQSLTSAFAALSSNYEVSVLWIANDIKKDCVPNILLRAGDNL